MHPRIAELFAYLDQQHAELRATYMAVPEEARERRPTESQWSPAEVLAHLVLIERRMAHLFASLIGKARVAGVPDEQQTSPILPTIDLAVVEDRSRRLTAPPPVDPRVANERFDWDDYERARGAVRSAVLTGDGLAFGEIAHPHPIFGPLNLYAWVAFIGAHAARHGAQIREAAHHPHP